MSAPVIAATDGSGQACRAVAWAAADAERRRCGLLIVHALPPAIFDVPVETPPGLRAARAAQADRLLADAALIARSGRPELKVETRMLHDGVGHALIRRAGDAVELVVGQRGRGGFGGLLLGSVGLRVACHARGPVVVVRGEPRDALGEVVVGIDPACDPEPVLAYAFEAAALRGAGLRLIYAWNVPADLRLSGVAVDPADVESALRERLGRLAGPWRERHPLVKAVEEAPCGHPVEVLCEAGREADLVVVGGHRREGLPLAAALGSVAHGLLHHSPCPVAVVRAR